MYTQGWVLLGGRAQRGHGTTVPEAGFEDPHRRSDFIKLETASAGKADRVGLGAWKNKSEKTESEKTEAQ